MAVALKVFSLTCGCPVCGGSANARYQGSQENEGPGLRRKCTDCGFTWDERPALRLL